MLILDEYSLVSKNKFGLTIIFQLIHNIFGKDEHYASIVSKFNNKRLRSHNKLLKIIISKLLETVPS